MRCSDAYAGKGSVLPDAMIGSALHPPRELREHGNHGKSCDQQADALHRAFLEVPLPDIVQIEPEKPPEIQEHSGSRGDCPGADHPETEFVSESDECEGGAGEKVEGPMRIRSTELEGCEYKKDDTHSAVYVSHIFSPSRAFLLYRLGLK